MLLLRVLELVSVLHFRADQIDVGTIFVQLEHESRVFRQRRAVVVRELAVVLRDLLHVDITRAVGLSHSYGYHLLLGEPGVKE